MLMRNPPIDKTGVSDIKYTVMKTDQQQLWTKITYDISEFCLMKMVLSCRQLT